MSLRVLLSKAANEEWVFSVNPKEASGAVQIPLVKDRVPRSNSLRGPVPSTFTGPPGVNVTSFRGAGGNLTPES